MPYRFYNFPRKLEPADYARAKDQWLVDVRELKDVKAVYSFGGALSGLCPGLSDLDLLLVVDGSQGGDSQRFSPQGLDKDILDVRIIDRKCFEDIHTMSFFMDVEFHHEAGEKIGIHLLDANEKKLAVMSSLVSSLTLGLSGVNEFRMMRIINVRQALKLMRGITHDMKRLKFLGGALPLEEAFLDQEDALRQEWFSLHPRIATKRLLSLLELGRKVLIEGVELLAEAMMWEGFSGTKELSHGPLLVEVNRNTLLVFSDLLWSRHRGNPSVRVRNITFPGNSLPGLRRVFDLAEWKALILPRVMADFFLIHADGPSGLARAIRSRFSEGEHHVKSVPFGDEFRRQKALYENYWEFLLSRGTRSGTATFLYFFVPEQMLFRPSAGVLGWGRRSLSRVNHQRALDAISIL